ncbi:hypothetical protein CL176_10790 [Suicoccus acidiformans]|uniref:Uncharacterized protein n=1 Tax=Suicoccus acidiformans TaxID=2036206 RepID=A0A347WMY3_9LACT|nr:hypothetical protein CL176_10790 [Suicoccus acidiformans]
MLIKRQDVAIKPKDDSTSNFLIERFIVPGNLDGLTLNISLPEGQCVIALILIYDCEYMLRAEYQDVEANRKFVIHEDERISSINTRSGPIPEGEWIIAFEVQNDLSQEQSFTYQIQGSEKALQAYQS